MAIGCHPPQLSRTAADLQQHAAEIEADILLCHRKAGLLDQPLEDALCHCKGGQRRRLSLIDIGELFGRQRRQAITAAPGTQMEPAFCGFNLDARAIGQRAADVQQLACRDRGHSLFVGLLQRDLANQLHLEIGSRDREKAAVHLQHHIGQNRQRLPPLDHANDLLKWLQQSFPRYRELHDLPRFYGLCSQ